MTSRAYGVGDVFSYDEKGTALFVANVQTSSSRIVVAVEDDAQSTYLQQAERNSSEW